MKLIVISIMKAVLLLQFVLMLNLSFGQEHFLGLDLGGSITSVQRVDYGYYKSSYGINFNGNYTFNKGLFISKTALGYQTKGFTQEIIYVDTSGAILGEGAIETTKFRYFGLTELAGVEFGKTIFASFMAGLTASYYYNTNVSAPQFTLDDGSLASAYNHSFTNLERLDLTGVVQASIGFRRDEFSELILGLSYNRGLKKIRYKDYPTTAPWYNHYVSLQIGVRHKLQFKKGRSEEIEPN